MVSVTKDFNYLNNFLIVNFFVSSLLNHLEKKSKFYKFVNYFIFNGMLYSIFNWIVN